MIGTPKTVRVTEEASKGMSEPVILGSAVK